MAKQIREVRQFLATTRRKDATRVTIVKVHKKPHFSSGSSSGASVTTKFKIRCSRYLYTLVVKDKEKAQKLEDSLPPTLKKVHVKNKK